MADEKNSEKGYVTVPWMFSPGTLASLISEAVEAGLEPHELLEGILSSRSKDGLGESSYDPESEEPVMAPVAFSEDIGSISRGYRASEIDWSAVPVNKRQSGEGPIRAQISRLTPCYLNLRVLGGLCSRGEIPSLDEYTHECGILGVNLRSFLNSAAGESLERGTSQKLSSGFPRTSGFRLPKSAVDWTQDEIQSWRNKKAEASLKRYSALYVGGTRVSDGRGTGVLWENGWINIDPEPPHAVALTEEGKRLARLLLPFFDNGEIGNSILPPEVTQELLTQIQSNMEPEAENIRIIRDALNGTGATNSELVRHYTDQMDGVLTGSSGNFMIRAAIEKQAVSVVSSTLNRLEEMGLVERERVSRSTQELQPIRVMHTGASTDRVRYSLSEYGIEIIGGGLSEWV
jgi:DNA-binding transcriptional ArsR family regulator